MCFSILKREKREKKISLELYRVGAATHASPSQKERQNAMDTVFECGVWLY